MQAQCRQILEEVAAELGHESLAWRTVPTDTAAAHIGASAVATEPSVLQWYVTGGTQHAQLSLEQQVRKREYL